MLAYINAALATGRIVEPCMASETIAPNVPCRLAGCCVLYCVCDVLCLYPNVGDRLLALSGIPRLSTVYLTASSQRPSPPDHTPTAFV